MPALTASRRLRAALRYASLGWRVLPLHTPDATGACSCRRRDCPKPGKHPRTRREGDVIVGGVHDASSSAEVVSSWWRMWPDANVGLATGELIVIDVDGPLGEASLQRLQDEHGPLPATLEATSGRGRHLYFADPAEPLGNSVGRLGGGLDVRGNGGYIVAPPSLHADGHRYRWRTRRRPAACHCGSPSCSQNPPPGRRAPSLLPQPTPAIAVAATSSPHSTRNSPRSPPRPRRRPADPAPATTRSTAPRSDSPRSPSTAPVRSTSSSATSLTPRSRHRPTTRPGAPRSPRRRRARRSPRLTSWPPWPR